METTESKAICTLLAGVRDISIVNSGRVCEAYAHVYHLV